MASAIIHIAIAKKVNEQLKLNEKELLIGSIAPDIAKIVGIDRNSLHFCENDETDISKFLDKYKDKLTTPFDIGYYIHLLTDHLWESEFAKNFLNEEEVTFLDGTKEKVTPELFKKIFYQDYSNLNISIIDYYELDLSIFYENLPIIKTNIDEMPIDKIRTLIDEMGLIIQHAKEGKNIIISLEKVTHFIEYCTIYVLDRLGELK